MNNSERRLGEQDYREKHERQVRELVAGMEIDYEKILPKDGEKFDIEDIKNWIGAVDFKKGMEPERKVVSDINEKVPKEQLLYSMTVTEAKMKVISEIAEGVYPAVAFQIEDHRKEVEKVIKGILDEKKEKFSLNDVLPKINLGKPAVLIDTLVIVSLFLAACGQAKGPETPVATATTGPVATLSVSANPTETATWTAVPTEIPTETASPTATLNTEDATATQEASNETKKAEILKMLSIELKTPEELQNLPVIDESDFENGTVLADEMWLIDNVLPPSDTVLPTSWNIESNPDTGFYEMSYNFVTEKDVKSYRGISAFFVMHDGKKMLRIGVEYGGKGQIIHYNLENPKWWTDPISMKTLIDAFNNVNTGLQPIFGYGAIGNWSKLRNGYQVGEDSSAENYTINYQKDHFAEFQKLAADWVSNRKLPVGADKFLFGVYVYIK